MCGICGFGYCFFVLFISNVREPLYECWIYKDAIAQYGYPLYFLSSGMDYKIQRKRLIIFPLKSI